MPKKIVQLIFPQRLIKKPVIYTMAMVSSCLLLVANGFFERTQGGLDPDRLPDLIRHRLLGLEPLPRDA